MVLVVLFFEELLHGLMHQITGERIPFIAYLPLTTTMSLKFTLAL